MTIVERPAAGHPTFDEPRDVGPHRRSRTARRVALVALALFVLIGAVGGFGVRTRTATATANGTTLSVDFATVTRGGLATPFAIELTRPGGFDETVTVAVLSDYMAIFDENGLDPDPTSSTSDGTWLLWEMAAPRGDTLAIDFDARLEPSVQWKRSGAVRVLDGDGGTVVEVRFTTWVMP